MTQYFSTIQENINANILKHKITKAICDFAIECIEPIKDKATTQRVVPSIADPNDPSKTLFKAWRKELDIDGYKGYMCVSLTHDYRNRKVLGLYTNAYNEAKRAYAPEPSVKEIWKAGVDGEQTWETFLDELRAMSESHSKLPTAEQVAKYLDDCQAMKEACELWQERRAEFSVYGGDYALENPSRWVIK